MNQDEEKKEERCLKIRKKSNQKKKNRRKIFLFFYWFCFSVMLYNHKDLNNNRNTNAYTYKDGLCRFG